MKIEKIKIQNFRSYREEISVDFNDLNVFVGKNDIGKSTILEALDIFFNENKGVVKIDKDDINKAGIDVDDTEIKISVIFSELPDSLTIDSTNPTTFREEYLLNQDGLLEVVKKYPNAGKEKVFVRAYHPTNPECSNLLLKKHADLKKLLTEDMACENRSKSAEIRKSLWENYSADLQLAEIEIELAKLEAKNTWERVKNYLPLYTLFQSDRKNSDGDNEIQDPMKLAVQEILKDEDLRRALDSVAESVEEKLKEVSGKTLEKLREMNPEVANSLSPVIPPAASLKWPDVFKNVSISGDDDIPINKRGSGVKRLVLLNFFRAEAERRRDDENIPSIIYAVEEPETSQHPSHQRALIEAFIELAGSDNTQILLTTHSPSIVKLLDFEHIKLVKGGAAKEVVDVERGDLPYPSLNEVNYLAFGESNEEYHNELYGFIESEGWLNDYKDGKPTIPYIRLRPNGDTVNEHKVISEYIRHQIHHPENTHNQRFSNEELQDSIGGMRAFVENNQA
ncbi:ATP-binding protein [Halomonas elongata]|uniref:ATP-binding protein n=1 Tax=Halomonas elongata (strain ATCC 33173 / DSM 2581 / NBRC 15536 / NCIMB 2198 / 1H9) TaxID=768066 RepID=A0A1R4A4E6_HALED|nr:ATP-binding protein [Halomonas elongata]WBF16925.1 ATP-binding protein [Halomonas elongata]WPU45756.1 ATP-binding protein [Halomonas elongata DSM 2581]SJK83845.1 uncharacterized protein HELO_3291H [Halomonas elongata DSM 2581]